MRDLRVCWPVFGHSRIYLLISRLRAHPGPGRISRNSNTKMQSSPSSACTKIRWFSDCRSPLDLKDGLRGCYLQQVGQRWIVKLARVQKKSWLEHQGSPRFPIPVEWALFLAQHLKTHVFTSQEKIRRHETYKLSWNMMRLPASKHKIST